VAGAAALVTDAKGTLSVDCAGWDDIEVMPPMTPDALFRIASNSKRLTTVALMMLVDEGEIALGAMNLEIHPDKPLAFVWMVRYAGFLGEGNEAQDVFIMRVPQGGKGG
jgi:hypothetical protein